jgi:hypothetical protein
MEFFCCVDTQPTSNDKGNPDINIQAVERLFDSHSNTTLVPSQFFYTPNVHANCVPEPRDAGAGCVERSFDDIRIVGNIMVLSFGESIDEYAGQVHVVMLK